MKSETIDFDPEFFKGNRKRLQQLFGGTAPIVLTSNGLIQRTRDDDTYDFHQDSNFWYLTGVNEPNFVLVIDKDKDYLIGPDVDDRWKVFHGEINFDDIQKSSGVDEVLSGQEGWQKFAKRLKKVKHVATIMPPKMFLEDYQVYSNPSKRRLVRTLKTYNPSLQLLDITKHIHSLRLIKQQPEISAIQSAIDQTSDVYRAVGKKLGKYQNEREISAEIDFMLANKGASYAFKQIVASGENAVTLHYSKNNSAIDKTSTLLIDMGASVSSYCADITRTVSLSPTKRQLEVYGAVLQVQEFAIKMFRPGVQLASYESAIEHYMGEKLREIGLIKTIDSESVRQYYPHRTSHFMGLDVHDVGDYDKPLAPGMVLTVEPGIYIKEEGIGIRIEDDILITEDGNKVLSGRLSRDLASLTILPAR